jgi:hypothetical protein
VQITVFILEHSGIRRFSERDDLQKITICNMRTCVKSILFFFFFLTLWQKWTHIIGKASRDVNVQGSILV